MNRQSMLGLLPLFALGACAQPQSSAQGDATADSAMATMSEEAAVQTVNLRVTGMT
ncbi:MAG: hypothetical protein ACYTEP_06630 [Planctomycetota bacterium]